MSIEWTVPTQKDILEAVEYVLKDDPLTAEQLARQILKTGEQELLFPGSGPPGRVVETRQMPYRDSRTCSSTGSRRKQYMS